MQIRPARREDARRIAEIHLASWQTAFRGLMPDDFLDKESIDERQAGWIKNIHDYPGNLMVAVHQEFGITDFICSGQVTEIFKIDGYQGQIFGIHVSPEAKRQGVGTRLMRSAFDRLTSLGCQNAYLWTLEDNKQARNFYEILGGTEIARHLANFGGKDLVEVAYGWERLELLRNFALEPSKPS